MAGSLTGVAYEWRSSDLAASAVRQLAVASVLQRLISEPCVIFAIRRAIARLVPAEAEILGARIANWPFAGLFGEMKDGHPPVLGKIDQPQWLRFRNRKRARLRIKTQRRFERVRTGC